MSEELKSCPYCSGPAELVMVYERAWVECMKCGATSTKQSCNRADELVILCWNEYSLNCEFKHRVTDEVLNKVFDRIGIRLSRLNEYNGLNKDTMAKNKAQGDCLRELIAILTIDFAPELVDEFKLEPRPALDNVRYLPVRNRK